MLYQELLSHAVSFGCLQHLAHSIKLVVTRPDNTFGFNLFLFPCFLVLDSLLLFYHLGIILQYVGQRVLFQNVLPQICSPYSIGIYRIASTAVHSFVKGQEPRRLAAQLGTHHDVVIIYGKMHGTTLLLQQQSRRVFFGVAVVLILLDGVVYGLPGIMVFQFHRHQRQAVQGNHHVYAVCVRFAVIQLACHTKDVLPIKFLCCRIEFRRQRIIHIKQLRYVTEAFAQYIRNTSFRKFRGQFGEKLAFRRLTCKAPRVFCFFPLCSKNKAFHPFGIKTKILVVVIGFAFLIAMLVAKCAFEQAF